MPKNEKWMIKWSLKSAENEPQPKEGSENVAQPKKRIEFVPQSKEKMKLEIILRNQRSTFAFKIVIFCFSAGAVCVLPFLVLQMQNLGLTINEIATIFLVVPFGSLLGPIVSGLVADKIGKYTWVFVFNVIMGLLCGNSLLIVPPYESSKIYLNCNEGFMTVNYSNCNECISNFTYNSTSSQTLKLKNCQPCDGKELVDFNCTESNFEIFSCPIFNISKEIEVTVSSRESHSTCLRMVQNFSQPNTTNFESQERCSKKQTCDYKCDIPDLVAECFEDPVMSDTLIYTGIIMFTANFFVSSSFIMLDATILQFVKEHNISIGKQKIISMIAFATTPLLAGLLIDIHSKRVGYKSYFPAFMMSNVLNIIACLFTYKVDMAVDKNTSNIFKDLGKLVTSLEVDLFLFLVLILGSNFGYIESYLFIYLQSLDAPNLLLGLTMTVGCLSSIPMLFCADWIDKKIGRHTIFLICFTAYAIRLLGYSFIRNPWMCLIFECFESITYQLMWVTCLKLCPLLAPKGLLATMTGLTGSVHYSFGRGIGGFIGGHLIDIYGMRITFRIFAGVAFCGGIFYLILHYVYFKRIFEEKEREIIESERQENEEVVMKILANGIDKCPSYGEVSMELHHSFLAVAGPQRKYSIDGAILGLRKNSKSINTMRKASKEFSGKRDSFLGKMDTLSTSVPFLYNADLYDRIQSQNAKELSKSTNYMKS